MSRPVEGCLVALQFVLTICLLMHQLWMLLPVLL